jgi:hypothetical protein
MKYRKMSDRALDKKQGHLLLEINISQQRIRRISDMLGAGQNKILSNTKLVGNLYAHYRALEALIEENQYRQIP